MAEAPMKFKGKNRFEWITRGEEQCRTLWLMAMTNRVACVINGHLAIAHLIFAKCVCNHINTSDVHGQHACITTQYQLPVIKRITVRLTIYRRAVLSK